MATGQPSPAPAAGPGRGRYVVAASMLAVALLVAAVTGAIVVRALVGFQIDPFDQRAELTVGPRGLTLWGPTGGGGSCTATPTSGDGPTLTTSSLSLTVTDGGRDWERLGSLRARAGSTYDVTCSGAGPFGSSPSPRIGRYVVLGAAGGGISVLSVLGAFTVWLVTLLQRQKARRGPVTP